MAEHAKRTVVDESDTGKHRAGGRGKRWVRRAITLLLLLAVIVTGATAYYARQQWWEMYMRLTH